MTSPDDARLQARLRELFLEELDDQLRHLTEGLEALADGTSARPGAVADLFRYAHSLKGAAFSAGATSVGSMCHDLEDLLVEVRDGDDEIGPTTLARLTDLVDAVAERGRRLRTEWAGPAEPADADPSAPHPGAGAPLQPPVTLPGPPSADAAGSTQPAGPAPPDTEPTAPPRQPPAGTAPVLVPADAAAGSTASPAPAVRLAASKVDALMDQAGELVGATYLSDGLVDLLRRAEQRLRGDEVERRRERDRILDAVPDRETRAAVAATLTAAEERHRSAARDLHDVLNQLSSHQQSLRGRATSFAEAARSARLVPFEHATSGLQRLVRELASDLGKQVDLRIQATAVEVDRDLVQVIRDVLGHLIRNAVDHGIEPPTERTRAGKPVRGAVRVHASLRSEGVRIVVSDDGRGLDDARLRRAAATRGGAALGRTTSELAFEPGVSTAAQVSNVSGRGVGLDAVRTAVETRGGTVAATTDPHRGSTWTVLLPLDLSTMRALLVRAGEQTTALPSAWVRRLVRVPGEVARVDGRHVLEVDGEAAPLVPLAGLLGWAPPTVPAVRTGVVVGGDDGIAVLTVDEVVAEREIVLRAAPARLEGVSRVLGTTQLEDGAVALVLNPSACARLAALASAEEVRHPAEPAPREARRVLLAEDSLTTRELERSLLESAGFSVVVAQDGQQAWELLQTTEVDAVVSDVNMPRMDGIDLCRAIRRSSRLGSLPIVLVTSLHSDADRRAGLEAGADAYLTKVGFNRDKLVAALERVL